MSEFKVERGVPMPQMRKKYTDESFGLIGLGIGDSVVVNKLKFTSRKLNDGGLRVWRYK